MLNLVVKVHHKCTALELKKIFFSLNCKTRPSKNIKDSQSFFQPKKRQKLRCLSEWIENDNCIGFNNNLKESQRKLRRKSGDPYQTTAA